ncbi:hypothetical protein [Marinifilum flexuosum]|uniref:hypothetical protein n=1 Tax=Marinifilum flexuosum TaxID=1117708 RepID=UPI00248F7BDE|nr:hypothetical protein [Marinifilum flexuosum]
MIPYIKKYAILLVSALILTRLVSAIILMIKPELMTMQLSGGGTLSMGMGFLVSGFEYIVNIAFVVLLNKEMKKESIQSTPVLVLTFFSSLMGVLFFLFVVAYERMGLVKK